MSRSFWVCVVILSQYVVAMFDEFVIPIIREGWYWPFPVCFNAAAMFALPWYFLVTVVLKRNPNYDKFEGKAAAVIFFGIYVMWFLRPAWPQ